MPIKYNDFQKSLKFTLKWEGGYVFDKDDPGGETKWGISKRAYPNLDIANLTAEKAAEIYEKDYWLASGCDAIPFPYNTAVFDSAVNCGLVRVRAWLRIAKDVNEFLDLRKQHYFGIINKNPTSIKYLRGWMSRLEDLRKFVQINAS